MSFFNELNQDETDEKEKELYNAVRKVFDLKLYRKSLQDRTPSFRMFVSLEKYKAIKVINSLKKIITDYNSYDETFIKNIPSKYDSTLSQVYEYYQLEIPQTLRRHAENINFSIVNFDDIKDELLRLFNKKLERELKLQNQLELIDSLFKRTNISKEASESIESFEEKKDILETLSLHDYTTVEDVAMKLKGGDLIPSKTLFLETKLTKKKLKAVSKDEILTYIKIIQNYVASYKWDIKKQKNKNEIFLEKLINSLTDKNCTWDFTQYYEFETQTPIEITNMQILIKKTFESTHFEQYYKQGKFFPIFMPGITKLAGYPNDYYLNTYSISQKENKAEPISDTEKIVAHKISFPQEDLPELNTWLSNYEDFSFIKNFDSFIIETYFIGEAYVKYFNSNNRNILDIIKQLYYPKTIRKLKKINEEYEKKCKEKKNQIHLSKNKNNELYIALAKYYKESEYYQNQKNLKSLFDIFTDMKTNMKSKKIRLEDFIGEFLKDNDIAATTNKTIRNNLSKKMIKHLQFEDITIE